MFLHTVYDELAQIINILRRRVACIDDKIRMFFGDLSSAYFVPFEPCSFNQSPREACRRALKRRTRTRELVEIHFNLGNTQPDLATILNK